MGLLGLYMGKVTQVQEKMVQGFFAKSPRGVGLFFWLASFQFKKISKSKFLSQLSEQRANFRIFAMLPLVVRKTVFS